MHLYFDVYHKNKALPTRVNKVIDKRKMNNIDIMFNITYNNIEPLKLRMRRRWCFLFRINYKSIRIIGIGFLNKALTYNIQRIENDSNGNWNYFIITDQGRIAPMRKTARAIRAYNPIHSMYNQSYVN